MTPKFLTKFLLIFLFISIISCSTHSTHNPNEWTLFNSKIYSIFGNKTPHGETEKWISLIKSIFKMGASFYILFYFCGMTWCLVNLYYSQLKNEMSNVEFSIFLILYTICMEGFNFLAN